MVDCIINSIQAYIRYLLLRKDKSRITYGKVLKLKRMIIDIKDMNGDYKTKTINK